MRFLSLFFILNYFMSSAQENIYDFGFKNIDGKEVSFETFRNKKILIVNTASECGYTPQYANLQELHEAYGDEVVIIGFPANNFGGQEPGSNDEIARFCQVNYGVTFLMAEKVEVVDKEIIPLFKWLSETDNPDFTGPIKWNFEKFLIDENGKLIGRFRSGVAPFDEDLLNRIKN